MWISWSFLYEWAKSWPDTLLFLIHTCIKLVDFWSWMYGCINVILHTLICISLGRLDQLDLETHVIFCRKIWTFPTRALNLLGVCSYIHYAAKPNLGSAAERSVQQHHLSWFKTSGSTSLHLLVRDMVRRGHGLPAATWNRGRPKINHSNYYKIIFQLTFYSHLILLGKQNSLLKAGIFKFPEKLNTFWMTFHQFTFYCCYIYVLPSLFFVILV